MIINLIGGISLGTIIGGFCGLFILGIFEITKPLYKITAIIITILCFSLMCGYGLNSEISNFNNGYCVKCGTKYVAISYKCGSTYYECPNCYYGCWY